MLEAGDRAINRVLSQDNGTFVGTTVQSGGQ
jgi:hypothetical protein